MPELDIPTLPRRISFLAVALLCAWPVLGQDTGDDVHISVKGLRLVAKPYHDEQTMRAFNWFAGTTMALQIDLPGGGLTGIDTNASRLESMTDDKGTDLLKKDEDNVVVSSGIRALGLFSEDGKATMIEIDAPQTPHPAATEIRAKGTLVLRTATIKKTYKDVVTLEKGASVNAGPIPLTVARIGKPDWGSEPLGLTLRATQDTSAITAIRFRDGVKTSPVASRKLGSNVTGAHDQVRVDMSYALKKKVDIVMIEIDYWVDLRTVKVPFEVKTSVGFVAGNRKAESQDDEKATP